MPYSQDANIAHWFHESARQYGTRPALYVDDTSVSYSELFRHVVQIASAMGRMDPNPGNPVAAVFTYRSLTAYAAVLSILYAGKGYVSLNPNFSMSRNLHCLDLTQVDLLVLDRQCESHAVAVLHHVKKNLAVLLPDHQELPDWTKTLSRHRFFVQKDIFVSNVEPFAPKERDNAIAYILFTSGTTGIPKGVVVLPRNVNAFVVGMLARYQPTPEDRFSQNSDLTFDASVYDMFVCWAAGACLYSIPQKMRMAPAQFIKDHSLTFWESVPSVITFMKRMYQLRPGAFPSLRWCVFGGELLTQEALQLWQAAAPNARIENSYGPTEGTICITGYIWQTGSSEAVCLNGAVPIGAPYPGQTAAMLVDGQLISEKEGIRGELCLCGPQVTPGYWQNPEETSRCFMEMADANGQLGYWYKTGDLVEWKSGVGFYYIDRVDRQLKIRGYRVELSEVEHALRQVSQSDQVAVVGFPIVEGNVAGIVGFVCGSKLTDAEILEQCAGRLPYYMVPRQLHRLPQLPLNANGKTDAKKLVELLTSAKQA